LQEIDPGFDSGSTDEESATGNAETCSGSCPAEVRSARRFQ
jgi:hypothetical protein